MTPRFSCIAHCAGCGAPVEPDRAFGRVHHADGVRHFCAAACAERVLHREVGAPAELPVSAWLDHVIDQLRNLPHRSLSVWHDRLAAEPPPGRRGGVVRGAPKAGAGEAALRQAVAATIPATPFASDAQPVSATPVILGA